jgi:dTDP-4-amino-4,6-dideoxygalactose transaminase
MESIMETAQQFGLKVIEDATEALGTCYTSGKYAGKYAGTIGDFGAFSFNGNKIITTGGGGAVTANRPEIVDHIRFLSTQAKTDPHYYIHDEIGYNFRMTDISAAIGLAQLDKIDGFNDKRIENADYLNNGLKDVDGVITPYCADGSKHVYHQYTIRVEKGDRDDWVDIINDCGVGTGIHYPIPLYNQPVYRSLGIEGNCPNAELAADNVISLPVHPSLTKEDLDLVIEAVKTASNQIE